ncbi:hypothetical protein [uncultured Helicobacter sp.]|uniref:hypothetical protein n=1 Tax=uncultured Helicobacter sp. TaxID=175537 RepID=UPI0037506804
MHKFGIFGDSYFSQGGSIPALIKLPKHHRNDYFCEQWQYHTIRQGEVRLSAESEENTESKDYQTPRA